MLAKLNKAKHFTLQVFLFTLDWDSQSHVSISEVGVVVIPEKKKSKLMEANRFTPKEHDQYNPLKNILGFICFL